MAPAVRALATRALSGEEDCFSHYQKVLFSLHYSDNRRTEAARRWLATEIYDVEDAAFRISDFRPVAPESFKETVDTLIASRTRTRHPFSVHMFDGSPTQREIRFFLHHHWIRSFDFYRLLAELAMRFDKIEDAAVFYRNLYGEAGRENAAEAHPRLLEKLIRYMKLPVEVDLKDLHPLEMAYLNNRLRCVRHPDLAWGLAVVYAIEAVSTVNHRRIYELLQRAGVPEEYCEFHRLHGIGDEIDTRELWELIESRSGDAEFQRTFLQSLTRHFEINTRYFDHLWDSMREAPARRVSDSFPAHTSAVMNAVRAAG